MEWLVATGYSGYTFACSQRIELNGRDHPCLGRPVHENICCTDKFSMFLKVNTFIGGAYWCLAFGIPC